MPEHLAKLRYVGEFPELATRTELSEFFSVSVATLARWASEGIGPRVTKLGHAARYRKKDILDWLDAASSASGEARR